MTRVAAAVSRIRAVLRPYRKAIGGAIGAAAVPAAAAIQDLHLSTVEIGTVFGAALVGAVAVYVAPKNAPRPVEPAPNKD